MRKKEEIIKNKLLLLQYSPSLLYFSCEYNYNISDMKTAYTAQVSETILYITQCLSVNFASDAAHKYINRISLMRFGFILMTRVSASANFRLTRQREDALLVYRQRFL